MAFLFYPVAGRTLVEKTYDEFGRESQLTYGNGNTTTYSYDERHQVTSIISTGDENSQTTYKYDAKGNIIEKNGEHNNYKYLYDILGRLTSAYGRGQELSVKYDSFNRTVALTNYINGEGYTTEYTYNNAKGIIEKTRTENSSEESVFEKTYSIDALGRLESYLYSLEGDNNYTVAFEYLEGSGENTTTTLVKKMTVGGVEYEYSYDALGNIIEIKKNNAVVQSYVYDSLNQLIRENNAETNQTVVYSYDNHGNILSKTVYPFTLGEIDSEGTTINYGYDSNWTDLLVQFNGQAITYDQIGNPLTYRDGMLFGWSGGRKLSNIAFYDGESYQDSFYNYNDNGIRVYKNANGVITQYYLNGSTIMTEITGSRRVDYIYDESGSIYGFSVGGEDYYYLKNIQGDITGIIDKNGNLLVSYVYTAYGVPTVSFPGITEDMTEAEKQAIYSLGNINPFRYRGYYYDTESGFYYLNSRYYDPVTGRFINADGYVSTGQGVLAQNMFAYCQNNPVMLVDPTGNISLIAVLFGVVVIGGILLGVSGSSINTTVDNVEEPESIPAPPKKGETTTPVVNPTPKQKDNPIEKWEEKGVVFVPDESGNGGRIINSYLIKDGVEMTLYAKYILYESEYSSNFSGSLEGFVFEWEVHNIAYWYYSMRGNEAQVERAKHLDVGKTIYEDDHKGYSYWMLRLYEIMYPKQSADDLLRHNLK